MVAMLGAEQPHFAQLAVSMDNAANGTNISTSRATRSFSPPRLRP